MQSIVSFVSLKTRASNLSNLAQRHYFVKEVDDSMDFVLYELLPNNGRNEIVTGTRHEIACALDALLELVRDQGPRSKPTIQINGHAAGSKEQGGPGVEVHILQVGLYRFELRTTEKEAEFIRQTLIRDVAAPIY